MASENGQLKKEGFCKSCTAPIYWITTVNGKNMPVNREVKVILDDMGKLIRGHESHFSTCPQGQQWRGNRG